MKYLSIALLWWATSLPWCYLVANRAFFEALLVYVTGVVAMMILAARKD